jgi:RND family efflux transporter MFP subunit
MQPPVSRPDPSAAERVDPAPQTPDDTSRQESGGVSTRFEPDTGRQLKKAVLIAGVVLIIGFIAVRIDRYFHEHAVANVARSDSRAAPEVDIVVAKPVTVGQELTLPGQTAAWYESTVYARVNGYVASWVVDIGDRVKKGQLLATIETPELDAELAASRAALQASRAQVTAREAESEFAETTNERWRDAPKGVVSEQERESKKADYNSAKARLYAAKAQVALDQSRVAQYSALAAFKQVRAPFDGIITERKIDVGNLVTAGSTSSTTSLYRISQNDPLRVFVDVPQRAADELMKQGVPAQIRAAGSAAAVSGKVTRSADAINPQARTMRTEVDLPNADNALLPGMYVSVSFQLPAKGQVEVPAAALIFRTGGPEVARVGSDGKVQFVKVTIARDDGTVLELGPGIDPGDRLVLNISSQISAGETVAISNPSLASAVNGTAASGTAASR